MVEAAHNARTATRSETKRFISIPQARIVIAKLIAIAHLRNVRCPPIADMAAMGVGTTSVLRS
jgi:hypothetical protein